MEMARARLLITGRVQGVFYRAFTMDLAERLGLSGWVRNLPDGRVEAVFEGSRALIDQAVKDCRRGPAGARVIDINLQWEEFSGETAGFEITY